VAATAPLPDPDTLTRPIHAAMLSPQQRLMLQDIARRIAHGEAVSLQERITLQKHADRHPSVRGWLQRAQRQRQGTASTGIDRLLGDLDLGSAEPGEAFDPRRDDLGDWFGGAPPWLRRS
jgi:sulfite reductase beta subunit-like hemoprotein